MIKKILIGLGGYQILKKGYLFSQSINFHYFQKPLDLNQRYGN